jgi:hypothetical protein
MRTYWQPQWTSGTLLFLCLRQELALLVTELKRLIQTGSIGGELEYRPSFGWWVLLKHQMSRLSHDLWFSRLVVHSPTPGNLRSNEAT